MAGVSEGGVGRAAGAGGAADDAAADFGGAVGAVGRDDGDPDSFINSLIRSTIGGSRLARALGLTSSSHFWIRSSSS